MFRLGVADIWELLMALQSSAVHMRKRLTDLERRLWQWFIWALGQPGGAAA